MIKIIKLILLLLVFPASVLSQEIRLLPGEILPELKDARVLSSVLFEPSKGVFTYNYTVMNSQLSTGSIIDIDVDIVKPEASITLSKEGLSFGRGYLRRSSEGIFDRLTTSIIPVGYYSPPDWVSGNTMQGTASWGAAEETALIKPGTAKSGFQMNSRGIPGIREFTVLPYFKQQPVKEASQEDVERIKAIEKKIAFKGKTIGPTAPPADFKPVAFLEYIIDLKHQAVSLGWIKNEGIVKSLDAKLDNAKKKLDEGQNGAAKNILNAFINEVEAQGCATYENCPPGKHLTSEAYALLKYNAQYLIDNLGK